MKSIWINRGYRVMGNIKRSATMGRFGKNPNMKKEVVLSTVGTKYNSCRGEAASYWKKGIHGRTNHAVPVSRMSSGGSTNLWPGAP
jgi:hypothetical protein